MSEIAKLQRTAPDEIASVAGISSDSITSVNSILWPAGGDWVLVAPRPSTEGYITEFVVYNSKLYAAAGTDGILWEWNGVNAFTNKAAAYYPAGHEGISNLKVYRGANYDWSPGSIMCMAYGVYPWGGNCLMWAGSGGWTMAVPQMGTAYEGYYEPTVVNGGLCQYWNEASYSLHAVGTRGRTYIAGYIGDPGAAWGVGANRNLDFFGCAIETTDHKIYIGTIPRYGSYGGKCYRFGGTGYFVEATKWGSENNISKIIEYNGYIYALTGNGYLLFLNTGTHVWDYVADPEGDTIVRWCIHGGYIYALTSSNRIIFSSGSGWIDSLLVPPEEETFPQSMISYNSKLYIGSNVGLHEITI